MTKPLVTLLSLLALSLTVTAQDKAQEIIDASFVEMCTVLNKGLPKGKNNIMLDSIKYIGNHTFVYHLTLLMNLNAEAREDVKESFDKDGARKIISSKKHATVFELGCTIIYKVYDNKGKVITSTAATQTDYRAANAKSGTPLESNLKKIKVQDAETFKLLSINIRKMLPRGNGQIMADSVQYAGDRKLNFHITLLADLTPLERTKAKKNIESAGANKIIEDDSYKYMLVAGGTIQINYYDNKGKIITTIEATPEDYKAYKEKHK